MKNIVVVEDELFSRESLELILTKEGFTVNAFENPLLALGNVEILRNADVILSDISMPEMDGWEFYKRIGELQIYNIPFLFLTSKSDKISFNEAMKLGVDDFLTKPISTDELLSRINKRLTKKVLIDKKFEKLKRDISLYVPHELRTPLIPIIGFTEMMLEDGEEMSKEEMLQYIDIIHRAALRFRRRLEKFNLFAELLISKDEKAENDIKYNTNPNQIYWKDFLKNSYECFDRIEDIQIDFEEVELPIVESYFSNAVLELAENAAKFSAQKTPIIIKGEKDGNYYKVIVSNVGKPFPKECLASFVQHNRDRDQQQGNGLGLAICSMITKKYNGKIDVFANPTRVELKFPFQV